MMVGKRQEERRGVGWGWGWNGPVGWCLCCEGAGMVMGVPLAFVLEVGCFGRGRTLAVIEGRSMWYGRSSWK